MSGDFATKQDMTDFKAEVSKQFERVHTGLEGLTEIMREQIKQEGDLRRHGDLVQRIGKQVDGLETRMRTQENISAVNSKSVGRWNRLVDRVLQFLIMAALIYVTGVHVV